MEKRQNVIGSFLLIWVISVFVFCFPAYSSSLSSREERVFDYAGLFSQEEKAMLEEKAKALREKVKAEFVVLTVKDARGRESQWVADEFYFSNGFSEHFDEDGMVMLIDMDNQELYLGIYGIMIRILTDQRSEDILDLVYAEAAEGNYAAAALAGLNGAEDNVQKGIVSGQYNYDTETGRISRYLSVQWYEALFAAAVSAGIAGTACIGVKKRYQMHEDKDSRLAYQESSSVQFQTRTDHLVDTVVHHTVIPRHTTSSTGRGSSSAGRSSTHSHGGHHAGGRGRKF